MTDAKWKAALASLTKEERDALETSLQIQREGIDPVAGNWVLRTMKLLEPLKTGAKKIGWV